MGKIDLLCKVLITMVDLYGAAGFWIVLSSKGLTGSAF